MYHLVKKIGFGEDAAYIRTFIAIPAELDNVNALHIACGITYNNTPTETKFNTDWTWGTSQGHTATSGYYYIKDITIENDYTKEEMDLVLVFTQAVQADADWSPIGGQETADYALNATFGTPTVTNNPFVEGYLGINSVSNVAVR